MPSQDRLSSSIDPTALTRNNQKIYILQTNRQFPSAHGRLAWNHPCFQANVLILFTKLILNLFVEHILILQEISRREGSLPPAQAIMGCCPQKVGGTCEIFILLTKPVELNSVALVTTENLLHGILLTMIIIAKSEALCTHPVHLPLSSQVANQQ